MHSLLQLLCLTPGFSKLAVSSCEKLRSLMFLMLQLLNLSLQLCLSTVIFCVLPALYGMTYTQQPTQRTLQLTPAEF